MTAERPKPSCWTWIRTSARPLANKKRRSNPPQETDKLDRVGRDNLSDWGCACFCLRVWRLCGQVAHAGVRVGRALERRCIQLVLAIRDHGHLCRQRGAYVGSRPRCSHRSGGTRLGRSGPLRSGVQNVRAPIPRLAAVVVECDVGSWTARFPIVHPKGAPLIPRGTTIVEHASHMALKAPNARST